AFMRIGWRFGDGLEEMVVLLTNAVRGDVLGNLGMNGLIVRLIDLDDLLDLSAEIAAQEFGDGFHGCLFGSSVNLDPVIPQSVSVLKVHEPQARRAFD